MGSKFWLLLLGLAALTVGPCLSRAIEEASDVSGDDADNLMSNNVETSTPVAEEWVKVTIPPPQHVQHKLGTPLYLECEILGTPPPEVKWVHGAYNPNENELASNAITEGSSGVARVRSRLILDHIATVGDHRYTCVGQVGGQVVHATTVVKTRSSEIFPPSIANVRHRTVSSPRDILNNLASEAASSNSVVPAAPRITQWFSVLLETIGSTVVLPCKSYAKPNPQIYWLDNNDQLIAKNDPRYKIGEGGSLIIVNLKWDDMGEFHCVAKNEMGKDTQSTFIYPMLRE